MLVTILLFIFVVGPAVRWALRSGSSHRWNGEWDRHGGRLDKNRATQLVAALEERDASVAQLEERVAELENRLDFAERLLTTSRADATVESDPALNAAVDQLS